MFACPRMFLTACQDIRVLPDTIGLLRRLATDRAIRRGDRVRLWLLFVYLAIPFGLIPDYVHVLGYLTMRSRCRRPALGRSSGRLRRHPAELAGHSRRACNRVAACST